ncbi:MAG: heme ABC transporter permease [Chromatiales bacterium]|nr:heme ABC transporter permease [Chromatiales bacterium]
MWTWFYQLASPPHFYRISGIISPWFLYASVPLLLIGLYGGLVLAPPDYLQGNSFRIIYVHVPSAYLSMAVYLLMAVAAAIGLIWRIKLAHAVAASCAPIGASFTFLALVTGAVWGKPTWGTYWDWDPRLTSELILLFLFLGYMALRSAFDDVARADRASGLLAIVGVVNVPIIHFSVVWWNTLHQGRTIMKAGGPSITGDMLWPLLVMIVAYQLLFMGLLFSRVRSQVLEREFHARWVQELLRGEMKHGIN